MAALFFGKYRGIVESVDDSEGLGRITAKVPEVFLDQVSPWCWPCTSFAGQGYGWVSLPQQGDGVWIEFEAGDLSRPIWTGFWWAAQERPAGDSTQKRGLWTPAGHQISFDDENKEILLKHADGAEIFLGSSEIRIKTGGQSLVIDSSGFNFNNGALVVS